MSMLRTLGRDVGRYIILYTAISLLVQISWQPQAHQIVGIFLAISLVLTMLHCLLHDAAPVFLYELGRRINLIEYTFVAIIIALSFSIERLSPLFG